MNFYTLIHICAEEQSLHNNGFTRNFDEQIRLYVHCAKQLNLSLAAEGLTLTVLTNKKEYLQKFVKVEDKLEIEELVFQSQVPSGIKFYSAHFKLEVFAYLAALPQAYVGLIDSDMLCINGLPASLQSAIHQRIPLYYDITDQMVPAFGGDAIRRDKELLSAKPSVGLWAGGEFVAGPPSFFHLLSQEVSLIQESYYQQAASLMHQGDEMLTSVAIENMKREGKVSLFDAGSLSIVGRYWSYVPLHKQKPLEAYADHFLLHLPSDKKFLSRLQPHEIKGAAFFRRYRRHLSVSRTMETVFKNIKPYAKQLRKRLAL